MISDRSVLLNEAISDIVTEGSLNAIEQEDEILHLPPQLFSPYRFLMLAALWRWGGLDFQALKDGSHVRSDGNLASHLRVLENLGVIEYRKEFLDRRPKTFYTLTEKGKEIFLKLVNGLKASLDDIT